MRNYKTLAVLALTVLFLAACGSAGDILGTSNDRQELRGTVQSVDTSSRSIFLTNVSGGNSSMLSSGGGGSVRVYYDSGTTVTFNGQNFHPEDLESGDEVSLVANDDDNRLTAESVTVLRDVSTGRTSTGSGSYPYGTTLRGTVSYIDTSRRTVEIDPFGTGSNVIVEFDTNTPVYYNNQTYRPSDLERGDEVEIRARDLGNSRFRAQDLTVIRSISAGGTSSGSSSQLSTIRGTVRYVDTNQRTITVESTSWISGFNSGAGTGVGGRMVFSYDTNTGVEVSGQLHPVTNLEQGDVVEVQFRNGGGATMLAERIFLVRDVRR